MQPTMPTVGSDSSTPTDDHSFQVDQGPHQVIYHHLVSPVNLMCLNFLLYIFNARSLLPKIDHLRVVCTVHSPDLICVVETWLNEDILNSELHLPGYEIVRLDRNRHGRGVLIYVNTCYSHTVLFTGSPDLELLIISINFVQH